MSSNKNYQSKLDSKIKKGNADLAKGINNKSLGEHVQATLAWCRDTGNATVLDETRCFHKNQSQKEQTIAKSIKDINTAIDNTYNQDGSFNSTATTETVEDSLKTLSRVWGRINRMSDDNTGIKAELLTATTTNLWGLAAENLSFKAKDVSDSQIVDDINRAFENCNDEETYLISNYLKSKYNNDSTSSDSILSYIDSVAIYQKN